jgi:hypothetical protein
MGLKHNLLRTDKWKLKNPVWYFVLFEEILNADKIGHDYLLAIVDSFSAIIVFTASNPILFLTEITRGE